MNKATIDSNLKAHLEANSKIQTVFFNKKGEWLFHSRKPFTIGIDREEVLAKDFYPDGLDQEATAKVEVPVKVLNAKELIAAIGAAETEDEVNDLLPEGEARATVLAAAENRKSALLAG